jgi:hypothetical protein
VERDDTLHQSLSRMFWVIIFKPTTPIADMELAQKRWRQIKP